MASPSTPILDNFQRANGALGANWTTLVSGDTAPTIVSDAMTQTSASANNSAAWIGSFGANQDNYITGISNPYEIDLFSRMSTEDSGAFNGYMLSCDGGFSRTSLWVYTDGSLVAQIGSYVSSSTPITGLWLNIVGSTLTAYTLVSGIWNIGATGTDTTYTSGGYIGLELVGGGTSAQSLTAFGGGTIVTTQVIYTRPNMVRMIPRSPLVPRRMA